MSRRSAGFRSFVALGLILSAAGGALAQRTGYSRDEFVRRRAALMDRTKTGGVILFGDVDVPAGTHFRQDNDFFYFSGPPARSWSTVRTSFTTRKRGPGRASRTSSLSATLTSSWPGTCPASKASSISACRRGT